MSEKLLPCPFCGGEASPLIKPFIGADGYGLVIECDRCWCSTSYYETEAEATEAWNNRPASAVAYRRADEHGDVLRVVVHGRYPDYIEAELDGNMLPFFRQRTCRVKEDADTGCFLVCSECGAIQPEEWTVYYCWSCGAKAVD